MNPLCKTIDTKSEQTADTKSLPLCCFTKSHMHSMKILFADATYPPSPVSFSRLARAKGSEHVGVSVGMSTRCFRRLICVRSKGCVSHKQQAPRSDYCDFGKVCFPFRRCLSRWLSFLLDFLLYPRYGTFLLLYNIYRMSITTNIRHEKHNEVPLIYFRSHPTLLRKRHLHRSATCANYINSCEKMCGST